MYPHTHTQSSGYLADIDFNAPQKLQELIVAVCMKYRNNGFIGKYKYF